MGQPLVLDHRTQDAKDWGDTERDLNMLAVTHHTIRDHKRVNTSPRLKE